MWYVKGWLCGDVFSCEDRLELFAETEEMLFSKAYYLTYVLL